MLLHHHISMLKDVIYPKQVEIRGKKISIMEQAMAKDPLVRLKYSGKSFGLANGWKKWIGEIQSLENMNGVARKEAFEKEFMKWVKLTRSVSESTVRYSTSMLTFTAITHTIIL
jgi:hypothetical protein